MKNFTFLIFSILIIPNISFSQSIATYNITFESVWNAADHGTLPGDAHWSPLVGATHQTPDAFLAMGSMATTGIENVAETGSFSAFQSEINSNTDADQFINGGGLGSATGTITINNLQVSEDYSLLTLTSMIAPSPDWIIVVNSIELRSGNGAINNGWKDTFSMNLFAYDAGTDDGSAYTSSNSNTMPQGAITSLSGVTPFNTNKIGTMTFTYSTSTLNSEKINALDNLKIFPNPAQNNVFITNTKNVNLKTIEIYDILGKLVKDRANIKQSKNIKIDITSLKKGIYLLKVKTYSNQNKTQKLVVY